MSQPRVGYRPVGGRPLRHRWRFSELDPVRFAGLLEVVEAGERPGIYGRRGTSLCSCSGCSRTTRRCWPGDGHRSPAPVSGVTSDRRRGPWRPRPSLSYSGPLVWRGGCLRKGGRVPGDEHACGRQPRGDARRLLNAVTDRYLFPLREQWFGTS
jgi:hypothetical protein